jgi:replicative DNA helicase
MSNEMELPCDVGAEQLVLGALLTDETRIHDILSQIQPEDFSLTKHQTIYQRARSLAESSQPVQRATVATELHKHRELESVGGISYLNSLDDDLPKIVILQHFLNVLIDKSRLRRMIVLSQQICDQAMLGTSPAEEILADYADNLTAIAEPRIGQETIESATDTVARVGLDSIVKGPSFGISTGFSAVDRMLQGIHRGELVLIAARPSMGKTAFAMNMAARMALAGHKVAVFSLEMTKESLLRRMICSEARIESHGLRYQDLLPADRNRLQHEASRLMDVPLFISDQSSQNIYDIIKSCRKLQQKQGLDVVIIDYLQLITPHSKRKDEARTREVGEQARLLKTVLARELNVCCITLSQLSRAPEARTGNHRPVLSDLRDSGELEQHADTVGFLYRPEVYQPREPGLKGKAELIIAKQRNGPIGWIPLTFLSHLAKFENATEEQ